MALFNMYFNSIRVNHNVSIKQKLSRNRDQALVQYASSLETFHRKKWGSVYTVFQSLINWPVLRGYFGHVLVAVA